MSYYTITEKELSQSGIQDGELAIYTGTVNPQQAESLAPYTNSQNAYVYLWEDGRPQELPGDFRHDEADDVLRVNAEGDLYTFLRDKPSGYIRQISGPAKPITVANIGAIPLRVDTLLGKFTVYAGSILRLDASAPQREKKKVLLTISSWHWWRGPLLKSAELWDGFSWRRLNIRQEPITGKEDFVPNTVHSFAVMDGSAIVQYMTVNRYPSIPIEDREILMMDAPEPDPDFEIYITGEAGDQVNLRFNRTDYRDGKVVQRTRTISFASWKESLVYSLQKLRESRTDQEADQCIKLHDLLAGPEARPVPELPEGFPE